MTFPKAASPLPSMAEIKLTINSGIEVPKATTVSPIAKLDILNFLAMEEEPLTRKSAPLISITNPAKSNPICNNMELILSPNGDHNRANKGDGTNKIIKTYTPHSIKYNEKGNWLYFYSFNYCLNQLLDCNFKRFLSYAGEALICIMCPGQGFSDGL